MNIEMTVKNDKETEKTKIKAVLKTMLKKMKIYSCNGEKEKADLIENLILDFFDDIITGKYQAIIEYFDKELNK